jgi:hypothetical protein
MSNYNLCATSSACPIAHDLCDGDGGYDYEFFFSGIFWNVLPQRFLSAQLTYICISFTRCEIFETLRHAVHAGNSGQCREGKLPA